jgi:hypothetical protein
MPGLYCIVSPERAQGTPGARCTRGLVCKLHIKNAHEHTGTGGAIRHSLRNGFTAYNELSPATNSSCHRRQRINGPSRPGWAKKTSASLTPATGARTTRFCRTRRCRSSCAPHHRSRKIALRLCCAPDAVASTASRPNVRDDGQRPSSRNGMAGFLEVIWGSDEAEYFCERDWIGQISLKLLRKIAQLCATDSPRPPIYRTLSALQRWCPSRTGQELNALAP